MATAGLYRRALPSPPAIEFGSSQGKQLFKEALAGGTVEGFFKLISYYQTQSEPAYCGLATISMVLNALAIDPGRTWKAPWRWFDDSMLDCCEPLEKIKAEGVTFKKVACLAVCNGGKVDASRTDECTVDDFRKHVILCTSSEDCHVVVSYHRGVFKQTGTGHFSPIGGYHAGMDMVLILDVARFKYPPHWIPLLLLWEAMNTIDEATGRYRGFMIISRPHKATSILYTLSCRDEGWSEVAKYLTEDVLLLLTSGDLKDVEDVLSIIFKKAPSGFGDLIKWIAEVRRHEDDGIKLSEEEKGRLSLKEELLKQIREIELFKHVTKWLAFESSGCKAVGSSGCNDRLPEVSLNVCCQGAEILSGKLSLSKESCCRETNMKLLKGENKKPVTVVSGTISTGSSEQRVDILVPSSQTVPSSLFDSDQNNCSCMYPSLGDGLTVLLLALPPHTWSSIKDEKLRGELEALVNSDSLPSLLQEEVLHLQQQLHFVAPCLITS
ncbi:hypothetical protein SLA2020_153560 [Shorea laevis]